MMTTTRRDKENTYRKHWLNRYISPNRDGNYYEVVGVDYISDSKEGFCGYLKLTLPGYGFYYIYPRWGLRPELFDLYHEDTVFKRKLKVGNKGKKH